MEEPNIFNIPAYQRKRSIAARTRKKTASVLVAKTPKTRASIKTSSEPREMKVCGICDGYFEAIEVAIIKLTSSLREGDIIFLEKQDGLFEQEVKSMQINRKDVSLARAGSDIGLKVLMKPQVGGKVYKLI